MIARSYVLIALIAAAAPGETVTEKHPDGSRSLTMGQDKDGRRDGALTAWWPGGKVVKEKSRYAAGKLHGLRQYFDEKGRLTLEETWIQDRLVYPRSQAQTTEALARIEKEAVDWVAKWPKPENPDAAPPAEHAKAMARLNQYRFLCGLDADVILDNRYTDEAQEAADVLAAIGKLDHHPAKPPGWNDADFKKAAEGCGHGNLAMGLGDLSRAVDGWMDDSDASNIDRLGHRRWMLNPQMLACGYGITGKFSVVWAHDTARSKPRPQAWQAYPPPGFVPVTHFGERHAWHVSLNPADYKVDIKAVTFQIFALDAVLKRTGPALFLDYDNSDGSGFGSYKNARIVRPDNKGSGKGLPPYTVAKGKSYEAVIGGLKPSAGAPAEISFIVTFY